MSHPTPGSTTRSLRPASQQNPLARVSGAALDFSALALALQDNAAWGDRTSHFCIRTCREPVPPKSLLILAARPYPRLWTNSPLGIGGFCENIQFALLQTGPSPYPGQECVLLFGAFVFNFPDHHGRSSMAGTVVGIWCCFFAATDSSTLSPHAPYNRRRRLPAAIGVSIPEIVGLPVLPGNKNLAHPRAGTSRDFQFRNVPGRPAASGAIVLRTFVSGKSGGTLPPKNLLILAARPYPRLRTNRGHSIGGLIKAGHYCQSVNSPIN